MIKNVSIVIPSYNEEKILEETVKNLQNFTGSGCEIIIVDDGSTDKTPEIGNRLSNKFDNTKCVHNEKNLGKGESILRGAKKSVNDIVAFIDADEAADLSFLENVVEPVKNGEADITIGSRHMKNSEVKRSIKRSIFSKAYNLMTRILLGTGIKDHQCGLKVFKKDVLREIGYGLNSKGFFWDTEMIFRAKNKGYRVKEVAIKWEEKPGPSFSVLNIMFKFILNLYFLAGERVFGKRFKYMYQYSKFAAVGAIGALINTIILFILTNFMGVYYLLGSPFAIETGIIFMFFVNNRITFEQKKEGVKEIIEGILRSNFVRIFGILINIILLFVFTEFFGIFYLLSNIIAIAIASVFNFFGEREFNWKKRFISDKSFKNLFYKQFAKFKYI